MRKVRRQHPKILFNHFMNRFFKRALISNNRFEMVEQAQSSSSLLGNNRHIHESKDLQGIRDGLDISIFSFVELP